MITKREYSSYNAYLEHQKEKTADEKRRERLLKAFDRRKNYFAARFQALPYKIKKNLRDVKVICLGARMGEEVAAFRNFGAEAIGVDLVPNEPYVIECDFHNLLFEDASHNLVYTNCLDHSYDLKKIFDEVYRVLERNGSFVIDLDLGHMGQYESMQIDKVASLLELTSMTLESDNKVETLSCKARELILRKK